MRDNVALLRDLVARGVARLTWGSIFSHPVPPKPPEFDFAKVEGMLLGLAIGDALGFPTESRFPRERKALHGEVRDYLDGRGYPSDDTQLTFWTLEQLLEDGELVPEHLARRFTQGRIFGLGDTVRGFLRCFKDEGRPWWACGQHSAGNGALMRIAPVLVPHLRRGGTALWADTALATMVTHNDPLAFSTSLAFVAMLWELLDRRTPPAPTWWLATYLSIGREVEGEAVYTPRGGHWLGYRGPAWRYVEQVLSWALEENLTVREACRAWYSGAYLLETWPCVLYILMRHAGDPEEALVRAVNDTKDNDTIAALVGAAMGALYGRAAFPQRWVAELSGRTREDDDGRIFELVAQARATFWGEDGQRGLPGD